MNSEAKESLVDLHQVSDSAEAHPYQLRLYISGITPRSTAAVKNIKAICEEFLSARYELKVIDIYQQPKVAKDDQIVAVPTLIKVYPEPTARLIGDMSNRSRVLFGLNLTPNP